jgi:hypothetical protein
LTPFPVQSVLIPPYTHELPKLLFAAARGYRLRGFERVRRRREEGRHEGNVDRFFSRRFRRRRFLLPMMLVNAAFARHNTPRKKKKRYYEYRENHSCSRRRFRRHLREMFSLSLSFTPDIL